MPQLPKWLVRACIKGTSEVNTEVSVSEFAPPRPNAETVRRLNLAQVDLLVAGYRKGKTVYELAADFGIARQTVSLILKRNGVPMRMQGLRDDQRTEVAELRAQGWSYARLGTRFGVNASTARAFLLRGAA